MVREALEEVTGAVHGPENRAIDGCSIPTYAVPIASLAQGFARLATGNGLPAGRAEAARRLMAACMAEPFFVAGTGRADTRLMQLAPGRIFAKGGAEGLHCAALPELGLGIAIKCDDGEGRGSQAMMAAILSGLFAGGEELSAKLAALARPPVLSRNGVVVGGLRPTSFLEEAVRAVR
jgi:L-asparaginase II